MGLGFWAVQCWGLLPAPAPQRERLGEPGTGAAAASWGSGVPSAGVRGAALSPLLHQSSFTCSIPAGLWKIGSVYPGIIALWCLSLGGFLWEAALCFPNVKLIFKRITEVEGCELDGHPWLAGAHRQMNCLCQAVFLDTAHLASGISLALFGWNHVWFWLRIQELDSIS